MKIIISGHHVEITSSLRSYIENKLSRLERRSDQIATVQVILSINKLEQKAEATLQVNGGALFADAESRDMYVSIDALAHKLDRQLTKRKEKNMGAQRGNHLPNGQTSA